MSLVHNFFHIFSTEFVNKSMSGLLVSFFNNSVEPSHFIYGFIYGRQKALLDLYREKIPEQVDKALKWDFNSKVYSKSFAIYSCSLGKYRQI